MASISRLKMLWEKVSSCLVGVWNFVDCGCCKVPAKTASMMDDLTTLFDPSKNHLNYQRALDSSPDDAHVIPNMYVVLIPSCTGFSFFFFFFWKRVLIFKWLFTIEEANPTLTPSGNVNLEKMRMLYLIASKGAGGWNQTFDVLNETFAVESLQARSRPVCAAPNELLVFCRHLSSLNPSNFKTEAALFELSLARLPRAADG